MPRSTTSWQKRTVHLADYINMWSMTNTWWKAEISACTEPLTFLPFDMAHGSFIDITYDSSTVSIRAASVPSLKSTGVTSSPILKSLKSQRSPAWKQCFWSLSCTEPDMSPGCGIIACSGSYYVTNSQQAIATKRRERSDSRTVWKNPLVPVTSTVDDCPPKPTTVTSGVSPTMLSPPLKAPAEPLSRTKGTTILCHQALTRPSAAATVTIVPAVSQVRPLTNFPFTNPSVVYSYADACINITTQ